MCRKAEGRGAGKSHSVVSEFRQVCAKNSNRAIVGIILIYCFGSYPLLFPSTSLQQYMLLVTIIIIVSRCFLEQKTLQEIVVNFQAGLCSRESCGRLEAASDTLSFLRQPSSPSEPKPDKLSLTLEPESAAIFCQNMAQQQKATYCTATQPFTAGSYLVVDIGGGTVDISALRVSSRSGGNIEAIHPPTGSDFGGTKVNKEFETFLENAVSDPGFTRYVNTLNQTTNAKHKADLNNLLRSTFEKQKRLFGSKGRAGTKVVVQLPYTFLEVYGDDLQKGLSDEIKLQRQDLRISCTAMTRFFQPVVDGILRNIAQALQDVEVRIETIYLVGGFGGCRYIYEAISEKFGDRYKYITPAEPDYAIVRGAVLFRQNPEFVHSRKVDATYGKSTSPRFNPLIHDPEYKFTDDDGNERCSKLFSTIVERGDIIRNDEVLCLTCHPISHNQKRITIKIYSSYEKDIWYVTGKRGKGERSMEKVEVHQIGSLTVDMPILRGDKSRCVDITFDFSHTEIQAKGYDRTSQNEVKIVLDFLSAQ